MKTSVAFSGSGFKVPGHVGALVAIQNSGHEIVEVAGTSGGSIVAALYACGMSTSDMYDMCMETDWTEFLNLDISALFKGSYCRGDELLKFLKKHTQDRTFAEVDMPLKIVASDVAYNQPFIFSKETTPDAKIALAVRASSSIPLVYTPVKYLDRYLVDGCIVNNIPVDRLDAEGTYKLGIQMRSEHIPREDPKELKWPWDMAGRVLELMINNSENTHIRRAEREGADIVYIDSSFADGLDTGMKRSTRQRLFSEGYESTLKELQKS